MPLRGLNLQARLSRPRSAKLKVSLPALRLKLGLDEQILYRFPRTLVRLSVANGFPYAVVYVVGPRHLMDHRRHARQARTGFLEGTNGEVTTLGSSRPRICGAKKVRADRCKTLHQHQFYRVTKPKGGRNFEMMGVFGFLSSDGLLSRA
jgi:hypothetical protein